MLQGVKVFLLDVLGFVCWMDRFVCTKVFVSVMCVCVCVCVCVFVGSCLATKVFIGNFPATGRGWVIKKLANDKRRSTTNKPVT